MALELLGEGSSNGAVTALALTMTEVPPQAPFPFPVD